jgi:hypothetical protein
MRPYFPYDLKSLLLLSDTPEQSPLCFIGNNLFPQAVLVLMACVRAPSTRLVLASANVVRAGDKGACPALCRVSRRDRSNKSDVVGLYAQGTKAACPTHQLPGKAPIRTACMR